MLLLILGILLAALIFGTSALPTETKFALHTQGPLHPWLHIGSFALLALLLVSAVRPIALRFALVAGLLLFGYGTELRESRKDGWPVEQRDVQLDTIGTLLGTTLAFVRLRR